MVGALNLASLSSCGSMALVCVRVCVGGSAPGRQPDSPGLGGEGPRMTCALTAVTCNINHLSRGFFSFNVIERLIMQRSRRPLVTWMAGRVRPRDAAPGRWSTAARGNPVVPGARAPRVTTVQKDTGAAAAQIKAGERRGAARGHGARRRTAMVTASRLVPQPERLPAAW